MTEYTTMRKKERGVRKHIHHSSFLIPRFGCLWNLARRSQEIPEGDDDHPARGGANEHDLSSADRRLDRTDDRVTNGYAADAAVFPRVVHFDFRLQRRGECETLRRQHGPGHLRIASTIVERVEVEAGIRSGYLEQPLQAEERIDQVHRVRAQGANLTVEVDTDAEHAGGCVRHVVGDVHGA